MVFLFLSLGQIIVLIPKLNFNSFDVLGESLSINLVGYVIYSENQLLSFHCYGLD